MASWEKHGAQNYVCIFQSGHRGRDSQDPEKDHFGSYAPNVCSYNFDPILMKFEWQLNGAQNYVRVIQSDHPGDQGSQKPKTYNFHPNLMKFIWQLKKAMVHKITFAFFKRITRGRISWSQNLTNLYYID